LLFCSEVDYSQSTNKNFDRACQAQTNIIKKRGKKNGNNIFYTSNGITFSNTYACILDHARIGFRLPENSPVSQLLLFHLLELLLEYDPLYRKGGFKAR
jgi:hypothetical protein